nr:hypothetical protein [Enterococcus faecium]
MNLEKLSYGLGVPVLPISVLKKQGIEKLIEKIQESAKSGLLFLFPVHMIHV